MAGKNAAVNRILAIFTGFSEPEFGLILNSSKIDLLRNSGPIGSLRLLFGRGGGAELNIKTDPNTVGIYLALTLPSASSVTFTVCPSLAAVANQTPLGPFRRPETAEYPAVSI